jgi:DNA-binding transcriptional regulator YiaG
MPVAPVNSSLSPSPSQPYSYIGSGQMSEYNDTRRCSLCGVTIRNFRVIKPILRWDKSRPYFHRVGHHRGLSPSQPIGWSCGKHHVIDPDWLPHEMRKEGIDTHKTTEHTHGMLSDKEELREIREKLGLGRPAFARKLGVSQDTIFKWERGDRRVKETALFLARRLLMERDQTAA